MEFYYCYVFYSVSLTILRIDPNVTSFSQVSQMKQYFIDHFYSRLKAQLDVINANKTTTIRNAKQSLLMHASGKSKPVLFIIILVLYCFIFSIVERIQSDCLALHYMLYFKLSCWR